MGAFALVFILFFSVAPASAVDWKIFGACSDQPVHQGKYEADLSRSVGDISEDIFKTYKVPYIGGASGFSSILETPTDLSNIEIISDREMRVYGWCFTVNGTIPTKMPDQIWLKTNTDTINWFYAYSTNFENQWIDYCVPAYWEPSKQWCSGTK